MKTVIYIFILLFISLLVRSICIEIREYYYKPLIKELFINSDNCKPTAVMSMNNLPPKIFHEYIQQQMKDHGLKENGNSLNSYIINGNKRYQLKKDDNGQYINEPLTSDRDDELKNIINLSKGIINIEVNNPGMLGKKIINLYGCNFIRNSDIDVKTTLSFFPNFTEIINMLADSRIGGLKLGVGDILNQLSGKTYTKQVPKSSFGLNSFQVFKYNKKYTILYEGKKKKISIYIINTHIHQLNNQLIKEKGKSKKNNDKINKITNQIKIMEEQYKLVYNKFKEDIKQFDMQESDYTEYIVDNKKEKSKISEFNKMLIKIYYMGMFTDLPYECRTKHIGNDILSLFFVQPKGTKDKYLLSYKLVDNPKKPPHNSHVIIATKQ